MKKSVEILGLPIISITEGRELGVSKTLLIDAKNGTVAAITIEDADWYRGVKLIPYESVIAIGDDAVTITNSENILTLDAAGDYEALLDDNIRIIDTKAITKSGTIQGKVTELYIGDDGKIEKCEITAPDGTTSDIATDQISIFGKQVTVIDPTGEKKNNVMPKAPEVSHAAPAAPEVPAVPAEPEAPKAEEAPKAPEAPKAAEPAVKAEEAPKAEAPKAEVKPEPKKEAPKAAPAPKAEPKKEAPKAEAAKQAAADKASEERHRRFLLGKKAARDIKMDNGIVIVEAGQDITEEVLQKAKLANKFIELSMNVQ
ncbi:PRC-barrel domain-containing protein [Selenomonas ruminantium]|uniref:PRC-barrel domain-containing protein n=1 Tax=Selenomonas ruminantium TaxID=971 RepID=UPI0026F13BAE|nr:PRC-barrel domain-containing protein [Selenomonas ruminantium]